MEHYISPLKARERQSNQHNSSRRSCEKMAPFRLENILIIYPKSQTTLVQFGLNDETFNVPEYEIPTKIYKSIDDDHKFYSKKEDSLRTTEIFPLKNGSIANLPAFLQYLKLIYGSIISTTKENEKTEQNNNDTIQIGREFSNIPVLIVTHYTWSQIQLEKITQFCFEHLKINNLLLLQSSLATTYALVSQQNSIIIDIGANHTDIIPIIDYVPLNHLASTLKIGGQCINSKLKELLPNWSDANIEILKKSNIFEVVNEDMKKFHKIGQSDDDNAEEILNVADIVTSGRDTREVLEERERLKREKKKNVPNVDLEFNTFWDQDGNEITVGKQRFQGCDDLISRISERVGFVMSQVQDLAKVRAAWDGIIITGATSSIQGFKDALLVQLIKDHLISEPEREKSKREKDVYDSLPAYKRNKNKFMDSSNMQAVEYQQAPNAIKLAKYPEYFPNWKKHGYAEVTFLGAQIVSKQVFTHSRETLYITREKYEEVGPMCIWELEL